ncbi:MAG: sigma-54-dependent Fis family transcriptional regulator [Deltaproteobacteria bacterium]|nr:sigma-54-dependent Fis family transcriptional regulator [Deltaproteobacteria bacterium]
MDKKATILVVDDEFGVRESFKMVLKDSCNVLLAATGHEAIDVFTKNSVDLILLDILLPDIDGLQLLERLKTVDPNTEIIMVTAVREIQSAVRAIKLGAYEYIIKPFVVEEVVNIINRALEKRNLVKELTYLRNELKRVSPFEKIVGEDQKMQGIFELISTISESEGPVLIQGESGTGKELVARAIHNLSPRTGNPFVVINCAAIPISLMESEIFGHHRGAFTGAIRTTVGKLEMASKGTIFLDDIDTLDVSMQAKLLRVIQEREFERLGGTKVINIDARFIAASNRDLSALMSRGEFREDLFYRLNVFPIQLPPLRERRRDIPLLLDYFLDHYAKKTGKHPKRFSKRAVKVLSEYDWPGNVRELQNLVERSFTITKHSVIHLKDISSFNTTVRKSKDMTLKEAVNNFEQQYISEVLDLVDRNRKKAAQILGIHRNTLTAKISELGLKK